MRSAAQERWRALPRACDGERALPSSWRVEHRASHARGPGAQSASELEARVLFSRGEGDSAQRARGGSEFAPAAFAWVRGPAVRGGCRRIAVESPTMTQEGATPRGLGWQHQKQTPVYGHAKGL